jgi:RNA polymerase sigma factor (sigma-70 family)
VGTVHTLDSSMSRARENSAEKWPDAEFKQIFLENYSRIVRVLMRLLGDPTRAEEVANDVFWRLHQQPVVLRDKGSLSGWLYRTATRLGIDQMRASARRTRYESAAGNDKERNSSPEGPLENLITEERRRRVRAVLASIRPAQAQLLILRASGLSYKELGEALEVKQSGIGTMLHRAEEEFRQCYLQLHGNEEGL